MANLKNQEKINASLRVKLIRSIYNTKTWLREPEDKSLWYSENEKTYCDFVPSKHLKKPKKSTPHPSKPQIGQSFLRREPIRHKPIEIIQKPRIIVLHFGKKESLPEDILGSAFELTDKVANKDIAQQSKYLLSVIREALYKYRKSHIDFSSIPKLSSFLAEDGSILFEWIFKEYRIGFSIEVNLDESSWYLVTTKSLGGINASGFIQDNDLNTSIPWLLDFILSHPSKK